jgi:hypothetical protein
LSCGVLRARGLFYFWGGEMIAKNLRRERGNIRIYGGKEV